jgi:GNAT superfamily N-acetyltransferase
MSMHIRALTRAELPALLALYRHLHPHDEALPDDASVGVVWDELLSNPRYRYLGVYVEDILIASCTISIIPNLTRGGRPYGLIENVVTHSDYQGRGYGKAVLREALSFAWSQRCYKVMLMTSRKDEAILKFYAAAGFDRHDKQAFVIRPEPAA